MVGIGHWMVKFLTSVELLPCLHQELLQDISLPTTWIGNSTVNHSEVQNNELRTNLGEFGSNKIRIFKAALINVFISQLLKWLCVIWNYRTLLFALAPSSMEHFSAQLIVLISVPRNFTVLVHSKAGTAGSCFQSKSCVKPTIPSTHLPRTQQINRIKLFILDV